TTQGCGANKTMGELHLCLPLKLPNLPQFCGLSILRRLSPNALNIRRQDKKITFEMNCDRTWQRLVCIVSLVSVCFLGLVAFDRVSAQQQPPTVTGKSKGRSVSREEGRQK